jgi:nitroreductase
MIVCWYFLTLPLTTESNQMIERLRQLVHILEKLESRDDNVYRIYEAKTLYTQFKDKLSISEDNWIQSVLFDKPIETIVDNSQTDILSIIQNRRSVRKWTNKEVSIVDIALMLLAAQYAPSSCNRQIPEFIVIYDKDVIDKLAQCKNQSFIKNASCCIVVVADLSKYNNGDKLYFAHCDSAAAIQNILLTIHYLGLGGCWVNAATDETKTNIYELLHLDKSYIVGGIIPIGHYDYTPKIPGRKHTQWYLNYYGNLPNSSKKS